jgi:hypothetical protein
MQAVWRRKVGAAAAAALGGLVVALVAVGRGGGGGQQTVLYRPIWHTLRPDGLVRADEDFGPPMPTKSAKHKAQPSPFFGLQHFPGSDGLAASKRQKGLTPSIKAAPALAQMLHQQQPVNLPDLWSEAASAPQRAKKAAPTQTLKDFTPQSSYIDIPTAAASADGYVDANAYRSELSDNAVKGQDAYVANWKAKNLRAGKQMVKDAAKLYAKWDLVDPYTGRSGPNLVVPHDTSDARSTSMRLYKNGPMLTDAHLMMLKEVEADNGRTFILPWWCVVVHPEANGDGRATGLSDGYGYKYPEGEGWDGAKTPLGASGIPGVDCTHPGGSTLVPYDKEWPNYLGARPGGGGDVPVAAAEPVSEEEAADLEEDEAAEDEEPAEEGDAAQGNEPADEGEDPAAVDEEGAAAEEPAEEEPAAAEEGAEGDEGAAAEEPATAAERDVAREQMLPQATDWPSGQWRHGLNTDNALSNPRLASARSNSDGPEYNVMEDDFVYPDYKARPQMLVESNGDLEADDVGDEIFELPQDYGDVQVNPDQLEYTMFPGHYY